MNEKIKITGEYQRENAIGIIKLLPLEPKHEVIIRPAKKDRTLAQNAIYWTWLGVLAKQYGDTKEERAYYYKEKYLCNIYRRDDRDYELMWRSIFEVQAEMGHSAYMRLRTQVIELTSTTTASVKQMSEYLDSIDQHAISLNINLPRNDDYYEAMAKQIKT